MIKDLNLLKRSGIYTTTNIFTGNVARMRMKVPVDSVPLSLRLMLKLQRSWFCVKFSLIYANMEPSEGEYTHTNKINV